ncbi:hypothetical protein [Deinococcus cellulosilyticus]|uniref:Uncharacterized protein n=1 Tax=Deinococcus cellulosilyticus (strain DSM 18568 / NBRC 106333 / KACC 11606 / 5516J-15) TaxID=1223518 RepID=A0A511NBG0_DEIC1|nr:hypothetical protein [Deinococcus cellulosilyticus]GEM49937.1 hypothetical protein DC3_55720 [Deinococcus cellulosilyticus NBRC 106333 = KACC 11606]
MGNIERVGSLEIDQDMHHEKREWTAQRFAWGVFFLLLVAALLGLFGGGYFSSRTQINPDLQVDFQFFLRMKAPTRLEIKLLRTQEKPELLISRDYLRHFQIENIQPEPDQVSSEGGFQQFTFNRLEAGTPIVFDLKTTDVGSIPGQVGLNSTDLLTVHHFVYP